DVPAASWTLLSSTSIQAVSPSQAAGTIDVRVVTSGGVSAVATADHFTYSAASSPSISSISPSSAGAAGGSVVSIVGSNFLGATSVKFGSTEASYTAHSATWISAVVPAGTAGSTTITVATPSGTSTGASFTLNSASTPTVSTLSVTSGSTSGGTEVTVL